MKTRIIAAIAGLTAVLLVAIAIAPGVFAQAATPTPQNPTTPGTAQTGNGYGYGYGMMGGGYGMHNGSGMMGGGMGAMMGGQASLIEVAADQLGMTRAELLTALGDTRSIAQVAAEHNVAVSTIVDAFIAARAERMNAMVEAGRLTRQQADQMLETMRTNVTERINEVWASQGPGYGDADGDGICDYMNGNGNGNGAGNGAGAGNGNGNRMHGPGMGPNR